MSYILNLLSYDVFFRAFVVGIMVSLCAALLGICLVLKRYSMIGDGLSHVGFGALALASVLNFSPLLVSVPIVTITSILLLRVKSNSKIKGDSAIALISSGALAIGVVLISLGSGVNVNLNNYMFGSILTLNKADTVISIILCSVVLTLYVVFFNRIFSVTFDEDFAKATGAKTEIYNMLIAVLSAITFVLGMRMMGALLISSLTIFPAVTSMRLCKKFKSVVIVSALISVVCFVFGMVLSFFIETPAGATVVLINIAAFLMFSLLSRIIGASK